MFCSIRLPGKAIGLPKRNFAVNNTKMKFPEITQFSRQVLWAFVMEGVGTTKMVHTFAKQASGRLNLTPAHLHPSPEELRLADAQLKDIPRSLLFLVMFLVPVPGFVGGYALAAISMEKHFGDKVKLLPRRFRPLLHPGKKD